MTAMARPVPVCALHEAHAIFCATGKSGLGHLRRVTNIASALRQLDRNLRLALVTNAPVAGIAAEELNQFARIDVVERAGMAIFLEQAAHTPVVVDTAVVPGLEAHAGPLCLILRETVDHRVGEFNLGKDRLWDLVCVPNPEAHWVPPPGKVRAKVIAATGWIMRKPASAPVLRDAALPPRILVASGGGGTSETAQAFARMIDQLIAMLRKELRVPFDVTQVAGPRLLPEHRLQTADHVIDAGSKLNDLFGAYDAVISTAGYNSVLELAVQDVPVLLIPISRSLDDQHLRARQWAPAIGHTYDEDDPQISASWLATTLVSKQRRAPVAIGDTGAMTCARLMRGLFQ